MPSKINSVLAIVIPCYNEEEVLPISISKIKDVLNKLIDENLISSNSFLLFVNDGSKDNTWDIISKAHQEYDKICGVNLAGNAGHQNALLAGLSVAVDNCDCAITIDADLQDDVNAIREMVIKYQEGNDIVYGVRASRNSDTWFKRTTAQYFYKFMNFLGVKSVYNHADFRLMSKRAISYFLQFEERNIFLRGIVPLIGYNTTNVYYDRAERLAGESKYPLRKMLAFAFEGITSFSVKPVHMIIYLGCIFLLISLVIFAWVIWALLTGHVVQGWASLMLSVWLCSGCILVALGIVGEYIGKIYLEVKRRPRYNIEEILGLYKTTSAS